MVFAQHPLALRLSLFVLIWGHLHFVEGSLPHYLGEIKLKLEKTKMLLLEGYIQLPEGLTGHFYWDETIIELSSGITKIKLSV